MEIVTVSSKFQVVLPEKVRRDHRIRPGDRLAIMVKHGVIQPIPARPFASSKGIFRGSKVSLRGLREDPDRF